MNYGEIVSFIVGVVSLVVGVVSIVLALVAISASKSAERESRENYDKTKNVLAEIDKRAALIEKNVSENQQELQSTVTSLLRETVTPPKEDPGERMGMMFMQTLFSDPEKGAQIIQGLQPLIEQADQQQNRK